MTRRANYRDVICNLTGAGSILYRYNHNYMATLKHEYELTNGAQGRNRTGTPVKARDFLTNYSFSCCHIRHLWSGLSLHHAAKISQVRRVPSSLYTFPKCFGLRSGLPPSLLAEVSPNLTLFTVKFPITVLNSLSPLRLPISPPGLTEWSFFTNALIYHD